MQVNVKKKAALYIRVSTEEQARDGVSIEEQERRLRLRAESENFEIINPLFVDEGHSAKNLNRPHMKRLLNERTLDDIDVVLVLKVDRLSRNLREFLNVIHKFNDHNVAFVSITEGFETDTAPGRMMMNIIAVFAEYERELVSDRTKGAMKQLKLNGKAVGRASYGYRVVDEKGVRLPIQGKLKQVGKMFKLALKGMGARAISERVKLDVSKIRRILRNPIYAGKQYEKGEKDTSGRTMYPEERGELIDAPWARPVVSLDDWEKVQRLTKTRRQGRSQDRVVVYELTGIIKCSSCGRAFSVFYDKKQRRALRCSAKYRKSQGGCKEPIIGYPKALGLVYALTKSVLADEGFSPYPADVGSKLGKLRKEKEKIERKRDDYLTLYDEGTLTRKELTTNLKPYGERLSDIEKEISKLDWEDARAVQRKDFVKYIEGFETAIESGDPVVINEFLKALWPFGIKSQDLKKLDKGKK